jgi:O-antigen/teichoic acid export membrane protein
VIFPYATSSPESAELAWRGARASVAISAVLGFAGCIASVFLVVPLFGQGFEDVPQLLAVLMLGVVPFAGAKVLGSYLAGTDAVGLNAASSAVMLVVAVPLYVVLIDAHGPLGAAAATAAVYAAHTLVLTGIFVRRVRLPLHSALRVTWSGEGTSADD